MLPDVAMDLAVTAYLGNPESSIYPAPVCGVPFAGPFLCPFSFVLSNTIEGETWPWRFDVRDVHTDGAQTVEETGSIWLAPGAGLVRSVLRSTARAQEEVLVAWTDSSSTRQ